MGRNVPVHEAAINDMKEKLFAIPAAQKKLTVFPLEVVIAVQSTAPMEKPVCLQRISRLAMQT